ncbi:MAG TPA: M13 family metallopeptidase [Candidatus Acidoferrum sp.]|nr:M13 family metallopeptidase [Candidatus Acidoferrum sp.]
MRKIRSWAGFGIGAGALILLAAWSGRVAHARRSPEAARRVEHGVQTKFMDKGCKPCEDFYHYANGGWLKANPIPPAYPTWGSFSALAQRNQEHEHEILEQAATDRSAAAGSNEQKIGDYYASCMNEPKVNAEGAKPLEPEFARIAAISSATELQAEIARLQRIGVDALFHFGSTQDRKNSSEVIGSAQQGGLGLPDRDYYLESGKQDVDAKNAKIREGYVAHVTKMMELLGDSSDKAATEAKTVMTIETELAKASLTRVERRDPNKTYHRMDVAQLNALTPNFSWTRYFRDFGDPAIQSVDVAEPAFFETVSSELKNVPLDDWKTYLRWHLVDSAAPALSMPFVDEDFNFNGRVLQGTKEILPRWKRCVASSDRELGFALGQIYVKKYFPPEAKARALEMVNNLIAALHADLETLPWMSPATREQALAKLNALGKKIGYPDKWRNYSAYKVDRGPYVLNVMRGREFDFNRDLNKIGKPVDRTEWGMTPPTVNAYYTPLQNEIVFPAGILQPPFFDPKADDASNYGGMGAVIGHEMTHGFDDEGRKFDAHGNLRDWWTPKDGASFDARAMCIEKQFDSYVVDGDLHENGKLVLGESIADLGGLTIAYNALEKDLKGKPRPLINGLTPEQRFFIAYAQVWAANDRPEFERLMVNLNPHALDRYRGIAAPSNMPQFEKAFGCKEGDAMVRPAAIRCQIW